MGRLSEIGIASNLDISQATKILHFALKIKDLDTAHEIVNSMKIGFPFPQRKALILQAHVDLGTAFEERKMIREAIAEFQKAASINTDKQSALYCKLGKLFLDTGDPDRAIEQYLNALDKDHNSINILQNLAIIYSTKGKNDVALQYLRKIITIDPNNSNAYYNMSCIYAEQHKTEESIKWLKVAIEKGFDDWLLLKLDKDLESIRSSDYYKSLFKKDFHYSN
jgi:tetratricopeptide (TPR) repeat protein